jgi:hypothetical protein
MVVGKRYLAGEVYAGSDYYIAVLDSVVNAPSI